MPSPSPPGNMQSMLTNSFCFRSFFGIRRLNFIMHSLVILPCASPVDMQSTKTLIAI